MKNLLDVLLPSKIQEIIRQQYKDQKILELETTQAIVTRLSDWSKLFGFVVGIPIALVLVLLGFLGFRTYADFSKQITEAQTQAIASLRSDALATANKLKTEGETLSAQYEKLRNQLADTEVISRSRKNAL
jgi:DNA gyrase/topoisomerase IV subunit A